MKSKSEKIAEAINNYLVEDEWHFAFDDKKGLFEFGLSLDGKLKSVRYLIDVKEEEYIVYAISPIGADATDRNMMATMAEFVCRTNYGLLNGNFEFDMRDGEIRYKVFVPCNGITPSNELIRKSIHIPAGMFKRYGSGILEIIFNNADAKETVQKCEHIEMEELEEFLSMISDSDNNVDADTLLSCLASRLGLDNDTTEDDASQSEDSGSAMTINMDLFGTEGA